MFYDGTYASTVMIYNNFVHIIEGYFYSSSHIMYSKLAVDNTFIQTNQLNTDISKGIFIFASSDVIDMTDMRIIYDYDASINCEHDGIILNTIIQANGTQFLCGNPMILINNKGQLNIDNIKVDISIDYGRIKEQYDTDYHYFEYDHDMVEW